MFNGGLEPKVSIWLRIFSVCNLCISNLVPEASFLYTALFWSRNLEKTLSQISRTLFKSQFWNKYSNTALSEEQRKVLNRLLDGGENGFEQGISASQYQKVTKVSKATATRHLSDLLEKECIFKLEGGGRNTRYQINTQL